MSGLSPRWDTYFMSMCDFVAQLSKDESSKIGCVIVGPHRDVRSTGYNGMPRLVDDAKPERHERPTKYLYFEHAERNALYNALLSGARVSGCSLYCQWLPCADCARAIIQSGIATVIVADMSVPDRWAPSVQAGLDMMREAAVIVRVANINTKKDNDQ